MKILITIPHYFDNSKPTGHGSSLSNPALRYNALFLCLFNLHSLFGQSQCMIDIFNKKTIKVNSCYSHKLDVIICTTADKHLLNQAPKQFFKQIETTPKHPTMLGFECQKVLKENLGKYDYYCFMEDDLIINDPYFFEKIKWFNNFGETINLLQPNRYEVSANKQVLKAYVDGDIRPGATENYQNVGEFSELSKEFSGQNITFKRPYNPHSGCYFLNQKQMEYWASQPHFLDMDTSFISPLESSATLGIMKTFRVYKPSPENANFFEIQHFGDAFLKLIGNQIALKS